MGKDPAFLWYPNDWIGGTMGMTFEQKGAYMELLMAQFNRGHMTAHMIDQIVGQNWDVIKDKFTQDDKGLWYNDRLEREQNKRKTYIKSRVNNKSGKNQYTKTMGSYDQNMTPHMENENENEYENNNKGKEGVGEKPLTKINEQFEAFRKIYPAAKRGYETELQILQKHKDWRTVIPRLIPAIENEIRWREQAQEHGAFVPNWPNLQTWLNQRRWEVELNFDFGKPLSVKILTYDQMCEEVRNGAPQEKFEFIAKNQWRRK